MSIQIAIDRDVHAAYIRLSADPVHRTVEFSEVINIDLSEFDTVVGIELLDEHAPLPFDDLLGRFHVRSDVVQLLRVIRPNAASYVAWTQSNEGGRIAASHTVLETI